MKISRRLAAVFIVISCIFAFAIAGYAINDPLTGEKAKGVHKVKHDEVPEITELYSLKEKDKEPFNPQLVLAEPDTHEVTLDESTYRNLLGFSGPYYANEVDGTAVRIINKSLNITSQGNWSAMGLVRNETVEDIGSVTVVASLMDERGKLLEKVTGSSLVKHLRSGEPAPFQLMSKTDASLVSNVIWDIKVKEEKQLTKYTRDVALLDHWELPYGEQAGRTEALDYPYEKLTGYKIIPSFKGGLKSVELTIAWLSPDGKVQFIENKSDDLPNISKGASAEGDFEPILVSDPLIGPKLFNEYDSMMWGVGEK